MKELYTAILVAATTLVGVGLYKANETNNELEAKLTSYESAIAELLDLAQEIDAENTKLRHIVVNNQCVVL